MARALVLILLGFFAVGLGIVVLRFSGSQNDTRLLAGALIVVGLSNICFRIASVRFALRINRQSRILKFVGEGNLQLFYLGLGGLLVLSGLLILTDFVAIGTRLFEATN